MSRRPLSPRQMKKMRGKMKTVELDGVEEVIIRFADKEIYIPAPDVSKIIMGGEVYQVIGKGTERPRSEDVTKTSDMPEVEISEEDVKLIMGQTGASEEDVRKALEEENGDLAGAVVRLQNR